MKFGDPRDILVCLVGSALAGWLGGTGVSWGQDSVFPDFDLRAGCPQELSGRAGEGVRFAASVVLETRDSPDPERGAQAWTLSVAGTGGAQVVEATTVGTAGALKPDGLREDLSFELTELAAGGGDQGAISAVILAFSVPVSLPAEGEATILRLTLEARVPDEDCVTVGVAFRDGLQGSGTPINNVITFSSLSRKDDGGELDNDTDPEEPCAVDLCVVSPRFRRGNCDGDPQVGLTDAVFLLIHLFQSGPPPACAKACDANDSGDLNLTDGVFLLLHLFLSGPPPPMPYPECGRDGTDDPLACDTEDLCA